MRRKCSQPQPPEQSEPRIVSLLVSAVICFILRRGLRHIHEDAAVLSIDSCEAMRTRSERVRAGGLVAGGTWRYR